MLTSSLKTKMLVFARLPRPVLPFALDFVPFILGVLARTVQESYVQALLVFAYGRLWRRSCWFSWLVFPAQRLCSQCLRSCSKFLCSWAFLKTDSCAFSFISFALVRFRKGIARRKLYSQKEFSLTSETPHSRLCPSVCPPATSRIKNMYMCLLLLERRGFSWAIGVSHLDGWPLSYISRCAYLHILFFSLYHSFSLVSKLKERMSF